MNREVLMIGGAIALLVAFGIGQVDSVPITSADGEVSAFQIPAWISQLLGGSGIISFIIGLLQRKDPVIPGPNPPGVKMTWLELYQKAIANNGTLDWGDIPLVLEFFRQGHPLPIPVVGPDGKPIVPVGPNGLPAFADLERFKIIFEQVVAIIASSEKIKGKGFPKYINAELVWEADAVFPFVFGIDPRPPKTSEEDDAQLAEIQQALDKLTKLVINDATPPMNTGV